MRRTFRQRNNTSLGATGSTPTAPALQDFSEHIIIK
jgi:hypothetical protein